jgi:hypothetical protein
MREAVVAGPLFKAASKALSRVLSGASSGASSGAVFNTISVITTAIRYFIY